MTDALADWLALREHTDWQARSASLTQAITAVIPHDEPVRVLDLATGTGSNLRFLVGHLPARQHWLLVDQDATLLALVAERTASWAVRRGLDVQPRERGCTIRGSELDVEVETRERNLRTLDDGTLFAGRHLVTASALLDLVSEAWLRALAARCHAVNACVLFTLTYDGRSSCTPAEPGDALVLELFNQHQQTDKGLGGPAAGPAGHSIAQRCFAELGYETRTERSDWVLGSEELDLQRRLLQGWAEAATEVAPDRAPVIAHWLQRRLDHIATNHPRVVVGHHDLAAWLPAPTR